MKLGSLSLACSETFIVEAKTEGPMVLRVKYPLPEIDECHALAKELGILIGYNAITPMNVQTILDATARLAIWMRGNDFVTIAAIACAYQNNGNFLTGACSEFMKPINHRKFVMGAQNAKLFNPIVFEYLWRAVTAFSKEPKKHTSVKGPISTFIETFITNGHDTNVEGYNECFARLNLEAGFSPYTNKDALAKQAKQCRVFSAAWKEHIR